jgi:hypothetical protein
MLAGFFILARGLNSQGKRLKRFILFLLALKPPDLPIEMPDLDITALRKLMSGLQGLRVCFCLDRFVRSYSIISIN